MNKKIPHPTPKPIELCSYLIQLSTVEGAIVLDPFLGSGTTAIAAILSNRHFIGVEANQEYIALANERISKFMNIV